MPSLIRFHKGETIILEVKKCRSILNRDELYTGRSSAGQTSGPCVPGRVAGGPVQPAHNSYTARVCGRAVPGSVRFNITELVYSMRVI